MDLVQWEVECHSDAYQLDLPLSDLPLIIEQHTHAGQASIDPLLKTLGTKGP